MNKADNNYLANFYCLDHQVRPSKYLYTHTKGYENIFITSESEATEGVRTGKDCEAVTVGITCYLLLFLSTFPTVVYTKTRVSAGSTPGTLQLLIN